MRTAKTAFPVWTLALMAACASAAEFSPPKFFAGWEAGQIEEAFDKQMNRVNREIINRASVWTLQEARLADRARVYFGVGGAYFFVFPRNLGANPYAHTKRSAFGLTEAHGEFDLWKGADESDGLRLKAGVFNYKYNEDSRNLGEYLYRTWTYPLVIYTGGLSLVDNANAQLSGLGALAKMGGFKNDLLLTIQTDHSPVGALSLTDVVSWRMGPLTLGGGIMLDNLYHPDRKALTPKPGGPNVPLENNMFVTVQGGGQLPANTQLSYMEYKELRDSLALTGVDTVLVDTGYYSFAGQKAMVRASLDLSGLLADLPERSFGVYFEAALLGIKDYPTFYDKRSDRTVVMAGVNIPTFGLLHKLNVEVERCTFPYRQNTGEPNVSGSAVPQVRESFFPVYKPISGDDLKWSVFAERKIGENLSVYAQVANDHLRNHFIFGAPAEEGFLTESNHWYWVMKLSIAI